MLIRIHKTREILFIIKLTLYKYTIIVKCIIVNFIIYLKRKIIIYKRFRSIQKIHVSMYLKNVDFDQSYIYDNICELIYIMFFTLFKQNSYLNKYT